MSEDYDPDNFFDRISARSTLDLQYGQMHRRETALLAPLTARGGDVLSIGCGRNPGRHIFPSPQWQMTGVELSPEQPQQLVADGVIEHGLAGRAGELDLADASFDAILYRLVLHHVVYQGPLAPVFGEAARLLRPGGALIAIEPGSWHPVGAGLGIANRVGLGIAVHGTPDDIPLSPRALLREARAAGLAAELKGVTWTWRRMPKPVQRALWPLDAALGERPRAAMTAHTLMLVATKR